MNPADRKVPMKPTEQC